MANILRIGILLATLTFFLALFEPIEAGEGKKKRVIIKVPTRIKHVYHHHTKKVHIRKKKPKSKPESVHVVHVEDETVVQPSKGWKSIEWKTKSLSGPKKSKKPKWSSESFEWKEPKGFASEESHEIYGDSSGIEDDFYPQSGEGYGWHEESIEYGKPSIEYGKPSVEYGKPSIEYGKPSIEYGKPKGKRGTKHRANGGKLRGIGDYDDPHYESSFVQEERRPHHKRPSHPRHKPKSKERNNKRTTKRPKIEDIYIGPEDYEDYGKGVWPERKEHPSWHQRKQNKQWSQPIPPVKENPEHDNYHSETTWIPTSNPIVNPPMNPIVVPEVQPQEHQRPPAGEGYHSQLSHSPDGKSIGYQSHVGHSSDSNKPSSSFQSVTFGGIKHR